MMIVDASVAVRWFVDGVGSEAAAQWIDRDDLAAPELLLAEAANALWQYVRHQQLTADEAQEIVRHMPGQFSLVVSSTDLAMPAIQLAIARDHPVYDCLYVALAQREECPLLTLDRRLAGLARGAGVSCNLLA